MTGKSPPATASALEAELAAFVADLGWQDIPAAVRHEAKRSILNIFATCFSGCREPAVEKALAAMARGAVMGEAGYFGQRRTANVDALTPVRLLRFDSQDLERLRQRYPRIAAVIYRNLNRIQAERLARATAMIQ